MRMRVGLIVALLALGGLAARAADYPKIARITVGTSGTLIVTAPATGTTRVLVRNPSAVSVYVGPTSAVTTATGFEIAAGDAFGINLSYGDTLYGVVAAATQVVHVIQGANPQ